MEQCWSVFIKSFAKLSLSDEAVGGAVYLETQIEADLLCLKHQ